MDKNATTNGVETLVQLSAINQKKSCSLPAFGPRGLDHRAIFAALAEEEERRKRSGKQNEENRRAHPPPSSAAVDGDSKSSLEESSISSDTSCSSVEFRRPEEWTNEVNEAARKKHRAESARDQLRINGTFGPNDNAKPAALSYQRHSFCGPPTNGSLKDGMNSDSGTSAKSARSDKGSSAGKGSIESINRKVRLEALKARIVAQREMYKDSSSDNDDEEPRKISRHHSDEYLHKPLKLGKRAGRTERFLKRRSQDEHHVKKTGRSGIKHHVPASGNKQSDITSGKPPVSGHHNCYPPSPDVHVGCDNSKNSGVGNNRDDALSPLSGFEPGNKSWSNFCPSRDIASPSRLSAEAIPNANARQRSSVSSVPSVSPTPPASSNRPLSGAEHQKPSGSPTKGLTVSTNLSVPSASQLMPQIWAQPSPNDSGVSCQSVTASPVFGRAPTPPPRGSQPKMGISQLYHGLSSRFLQNQRTLSSSLDTVQDSGRHSHSSTLTLLSETSSDTASPHQRISEIHEVKNNQYSKPNQSYSRGNIETSNNNDTPLKKTRRPSAIYSGSGGGVSVLGYISRLGAPVYSYTDQAPQNNKSEPPKSVISSESLNNNLNVANKQSHSPISDSSTNESSSLETRKGADDAVWKRIAALYGKPQVSKSHMTSKSFDSNKIPHVHSKIGLLHNESADEIAPSSSPHANLNSTSNSKLLSKHAARPLSMIAEKSGPKYRISVNRDMTSVPVPPARKHLSSSSLSLDTAKQQLDLAARKEQEKRSSANFEEALLELEQIYQSLKLNEEDLLDKAERRDLPSQYQWKRNSPEPKTSCQKQESGEKLKIYRNSVNYPLARSSSDSFNVTSKRRSSLNDEFFLFHHSPPPRTPPYRRSGVPDKVADDLAFRKMQKSVPKSPSPPVPQKSVSYLQCSPVFTPTLDVEAIFKEIQPQPNIEKDDLSYRKYTQADGAKVLPAHPPFGIPVGVVGRSSPSDYLHAPPKEVPKPAYRPRHAHDLVRDDMAYRNLRRDSNVQSPTRNGVPPMFFPEVDGHFIKGIKHSFALNRKKQRAERSLSANIAQIMGNCEDKASSQEFERAQSMSDIIAALEKESRKWKNIETSVLGENKLSKFHTKDNSILSSLKEANKLSLKNKDNEPLTSTETLTESQANVNGICANGHDDDDTTPVITSKEAPRIMQDIWRIRAMAATPSGGRPITRPRSGSLSIASECIKAPRPPLHSPSLPSLVKSPPPPIPTRRSLFLAKALHHDTTTSDTELSQSSEANLVSPLDEKQLDDLLSSLAIDAKECARRTEELLSMSDCLCKETSSADTHLTDDLSTGSLSGPLSPSPSANVTSSHSNVPIRTPTPTSPASFCDMTEAARQPLHCASANGRIGNDFNPSALKINNDSNAFNGSSGKSLEENKDPCRDTRSCSESSSDNNSRSERIARYKEERRRELAKKYGETSSGDDMGKGSPDSPALRYSYRRFKQKQEALSVRGTNKAEPNKGGDKPSANGRLIGSPQSKKDDSFASSDSNMGQSTSRNVSSPAQITPRKRFIVRDSGSEDCSSIHSFSSREESGDLLGGLVRSTRASRLRARANSTQLESSPIKQDHNDTFRLRSSSNASAPPDGDLSHLSFSALVKQAFSSPLKTDLNDNVTDKYSVQETSDKFSESLSHKVIESEESSDPGLSKSFKEKMKDKSSKRKSNLNCSNIPQETRTVPPEANDEIARKPRRTRRTSDASFHASESDRKSDRSSSFTGSLLKTFRNFRSSLDHHSVSREGSCDSQNSQTEDKPNKSKNSRNSKDTQVSDTESAVSKKLNGALKRPQIPDILRTKSPSKTAGAQVSVSKAGNKSDKSGSSGKGKDSASLPGIRHTRSPPKSQETRSPSRVSPAKAEENISQVLPSQKDIAQDSADACGNGQCDSASRCAKSPERTPVLLEESCTTDANRSQEQSCDFPTLNANDEHVNSTPVNKVPKTSDTESDAFVTAPSSLQETYPSQQQPLSDSVQSQHDFPVVYTLSVKTSSSSFGDSFESVSDSPSHVTHDIVSGIFRESSETPNSDTSSAAPTVILCNHENQNGDIQDNVSASLGSGSENPSRDVLHNSNPSEGARPKIRSRASSPEKQLLSAVKPSFGRDIEVVEVVNKEPPVSLLKRKSIDEKKENVYSILKGTSKENHDETKKPPSILKKRSSSDENDSECKSPELHSILKRPSVEEIDVRGLNSEFHSILKNRSEDTVSHVEPRPILKKKNSLEDLNDVAPADRKPILKKKSSTDDEIEERPKSILKGRRKSEEEGKVGVDLIPLVRVRADSSDSGIKPILKRSTDDGEGIRPILKSRSSEIERDYSPHLVFKRPSLPTTIDGLSPILKGRATDKKFDCKESSLESSGKAFDAPPKRTVFEADNSCSSVASLRNAQDNLLHPSTSASVQEFVPSSFSTQADQSKESSVQPTIITVIPPPPPKEERVVFKCEVTTTNSSSISNSFHPFEPQPRRIIRRFDRRNLPRYRTQPVTSEEVEETDSLSSVQAFRSLVLRKAVFQRWESDTAPKLQTHNNWTKKTEYPQPYQPEKRHRRRGSSRYHTLPVTQEEISEAEKTEPITSKAPFASGPKKTRAAVNNKVAFLCPPDDSHASSGNEDELSRLSIAAKKNLFQQLEEQQKRAAPPRNMATVNTSGGVKSKLLARHSLSRSQTQPVTMEEVKEANKFMETKSKSKDDVAVSQQAATSTDKHQSTSDSEDDPSKLSIVEKMKLFAQKIQEEKFQPKPAAPPPKRRQRSNSRFKTQPVTCEELEKANKVSPLAACFAKPPDPEILGGLPIQAARDLMYKHGAEAMVKPPNSRHSSISEDKEVEEEVKSKGILKHRRESKPEIKGILKSDPSKSDGKELKGILKPADQQESVKSDKPLKSALKKVEPAPTEGRSLVHIETLAESPLIRTETNLSSVDDSESSSVKVELPSSSSCSSSSSEDDTDDDDVECGYMGSRKVLTGGQSHIIFNPTPVKKVDARKGANPAVLRRIAYAKRKGEMKQPHDLRSHEIITSASTSSIVAKEARSSSDGKKASVMEVERVSSSVIRSISESHSTVILPQRSRTQPMTAEERDGVEESHGGSIADRLRALQQSGTQDWKLRLGRMKPDTTPLEEIKKGSPEKPSVTVNGKPVFQKQCSITERLTLLEEAQDRWKNRVEEKDAVLFTVAGKMGESEDDTLAIERKKRVPKPMPFKSKTVKNVSHVLQNAVAVLPPSPAMPFPKSKSTSNIKSFAAEPVIPESGDDSSMSKSVVLIPKADDETFTSFFSSANLKQDLEQKIEISEDGFDQVVSQSRQVLAQKRTIKLQPRRAACRNPIKKLASRTDIQEAYTEVRTGVAEKELTRMKVEKLAKSSELALSALAGLASTEDFKNVALRKSVGDSTKKDVTLIQVKGRRHVQVRLIEPVVESVNHGDSYVLVTPDRVYLWNGMYSNIIERAKSAEVATAIQTKKDLGFKGYNDVVVIDEEKMPSPTHMEAFFRHLGGKEVDCAPAGKPKDDEIFEASIIDTNMVYKVENEELVPYENYWGNLPRIEILQPEEILVFDFGSEMYVWQGKLAPFDKRKVAVRLAKELWDQGYDYSECDINPVNPKLYEKTSMTASKRPNWAIFAKINQHMEPVLFKQKFSDWPDMSRIIKVKNQDSEESKGEVSDLKPCDALEMLNKLPEEPDTILEGSHLGRGIEYHDADEMRHFEITTLALNIWHILEYNHYKLPVESYGQFHCGDTYVVRWQYMVTQIGRDLSGQVSRHSFVGRERIAYFFWQGRDSTITEKGASALMTVELDEERGPHVRVVQGKEPPCFLNLFHGGMVIYKGKREEEDTNIKGPWKFFLVRGELPGEAVLLELPYGAQNLRSRTSFILLNIETGLIFIWHGTKSPEHIRKVATSAVENLKKNQPVEMMFKPDLKFVVKEQKEGSECEEFWDALGGGNRHMYMSLLDSNLAYDFTPRLFYMNSISGTFEATEITCPFRSTEYPCCYPFEQSDLYKVSQPALFLLDNGHEVYVWQGWWPEGTQESDNVVTGSAVVRWNNDRRCALETALHYSCAKDSENPPKTYLVSAGLEPAVFTNLFPEWEQRDDVAELNIKDGKKPGEVLLVQEVLARLTRTKFTYKELQKRPLPDGVDPSRMESYLPDEEFEDIFSMSKEEFYNLPFWKQTKLKQNAKLF